MKFREVPELVQYLREYIEYGKRLGFFGQEKATQIANKILNLDVIYDSTVPGDAKINLSNIIINNRRLQGKPEFASLVMFHEFTHAANDIHSELFEKKGHGIFGLLKNNTDRYVNTNYKLGVRSEETKIGDVNNPYTYMLSGAVLLDEVICEHVATEMCKMKYYKPVLNTRRQMSYNGLNKEYNSHFEYYGVGEEIVDKFAKTLFLPQREKNLSGLAKASMSKNFSIELIRQHNENRDAFIHLIQELGFMGVISFVIEYQNGHAEDKKPISPSLFAEAFAKLDYLLEYGRENREVIPQNIPMPDFK